MRHVFSVLLFCTLLISMSSCSAADLYTVRGLGMLPGQTASRAKAINNSGTVVGNSGSIAFKWTQSGGMQQIPPLSSGTMCAANAINDAGAIAGDSNRSQYNSSRASCIWNTDGSVTDLMTDVGSWSYTNGINNLGAVVGQTCGTGGLWHGFYWSPSTGKLTMGLQYGDMSYAYDVNDSGQVVAKAANSVTQQEWPFLWTQVGGSVDLPMSSANAINNAGQVVGQTTDGQAVLWTADHGSSYLGSLVPGRSSSARAINEVGEVVGNASVTSGVAAFIWDTASGMRNLNNLVDASGTGWTLQYAYGINDGGQIVGYGRNPLGGTEAFLLTPVPEPSGLMMIACGLGSLGMAMRRRRR